MPIIPDDVVDQMDLTPEQRQLLRDRENDLIFRWYVEERYVTYLKAVLSIAFEAMKGFLIKGLGLDEPGRITDFEIDDKVARKLGGNCYPTDSVEQGTYWHFPDEMEGVPRYVSSGRVHRRDFRPTDESNHFFRVLFRKVTVVERLDDGEFEYRAKATKDADWSYGPTLGRAVCSAFLDSN